MKEDTCSKKRCLLPGVAIAGDAVGTGHAGEGDCANAFVFHRCGWNCSSSHDGGTFDAVGACATGTAAA
eukprot:610441-Pelagomonas_calceolata.AAC.1